MARLDALAPVLDGGSFTLEMYLKSTGGSPPLGSQRFVDFSTGGGVYDVADFSAAAAAAMVGRCRLILSNPR
jgi:hypothetical protein